MDYKEMERNIFADGCYIEYEFINNNGDMIRGVTTLNRKEYKLTYKRNKNYMFIISDIKEV